MKTNPRPKSQNEYTKSPPSSPPVARRIGGGLSYNGMNALNSKYTVVRSKETFSRASVNSLLQGKTNFKLILKI